MAYTKGPKRTIMLWYSQNIGVPCKYQDMLILVHYLISLLYYITARVLFCPGSHPQCTSILPVILHMLEPLTFFQQMYKSEFICNAVPQSCPVNNHIIRYITPPSAQMHVIYFIPRLIALTEFIFKCPQICINLSWADGKVDWSYFRRLCKLYMRVLCSNSFMRWVSVPQIRHLDCDCS